jgi:hypothetical protein
MLPQRGRPPVFVLTFASALFLFIQACSGQEAPPSQRDAVPEPSNGGAVDTPSLARSPDGAAAQSAPSGAAFVVPETAAGQVLAAAMEKARATDRLLFVHSGADW